ncbi:MAG TPA: hypothetical protein VEM36_12510 [Xanthobacteraceae bacterium]|nr:hypothetical protein [Xanthobacteraceae bacterium]
MLKRMLLALVLVIGTAAHATAQPLPAPKIKYAAQFPNFGFVTVELSVINWQAYSPALFVHTPQFGPCGLNPTPSRTWVNIYRVGTAIPVNVHCAIYFNGELVRLLFATPAGSKPKFAYITMIDRATKRVVKSNVVAIP